MENVGMDGIFAVSDAPKQRFLVGDLVEVRMREKGLRGSWHPAKVVEVQKGKRMVEYEELLADDEKTHLKELVSVGRASDGDNLMGTLPLKSTPKKNRPLLRPRPPAHPDSQPISWQEGVWIECHYEDAWWEGVLAENITTVNVDDVSLVTRKSEVDVLFPEENDVSKMSVNRMRIGQEWDEETGNWSLKGCVPVPVVRPNKKNRSKKNSSSKKDSSSEKQQQAAVPELSKGIETDGAAAAATATATHSAEPEPKATDTEIESQLCDSPLAVDTLIEDLCQNIEVVSGGGVIEGNSPGDGYEEALTMFIQGGGTSTISLNLGAQEPVTACPPIEEPPVENKVEGNLGAQEPVIACPPIEEPPLEKQVEANTTEDALDVPAPMEVEKTKTVAQNEEAVQTVLTYAGWKITRNVRRKTGEVTWNCRSPKVAGAAVKTFSSLVEALSYEAHKGAPGGNLREATSLSQSGLAGKEDSVNESSAARDAASGEEEDENDEYADSAREILVKSGWEVFNGLRTGSDGQSAWLYRTPGEETQSRKWFKNWRLAIEEYVKQETPVPIQKKTGGRGESSSPVPTSIPTPKKRGGRGESSSPVPPKRVTRRLSLPEDEKKSADGAGPSSIKSPEDNSDIDGDDKRKVDIDGDDKRKVDIDGDDKRKVDVVFHSGRKRTGVDLGQKLARSDNPSFMGVSYLEKPFGSVLNFTQKKNAYTLQVTIHDILKEHISVLVEKGDIVIKASYGVEQEFHNIPARYNGSVSSRLTLPKDVEHQKITAELKSSLLTLTLPKCRTLPEDAIEVNIQ